MHKLYAQEKTFAEIWSGENDSIAVQRRCGKACGIPLPNVGDKVVLIEGLKEGQETGREIRTTITKVVDDIDKSGNWTGVSLDMRSAILVVEERMKTQATQQMQSAPIDCKPAFPPAKDRHLLIQAECANFSYAGLPESIQGIVEPLAGTIDILLQQLPDNQHLLDGIRNMKTAKDCFVRASVYPGNSFIQ